MPGQPAAKTTVLAALYIDRIVDAKSVRDTVVRVSGADVGL